MFSIPDGATTDQIVALCIAHEEAERTRLLVEYRPRDEDFPIDPSEWGPWGPEPYEPTDADLAFLAALPAICGGAPDGPADRDLEEAAQLAAWQAQLEAANAITDQDLAAAGLPIG